MTYVREQYLVEVWNRLLDYLKTNRNIEPEIVNSFYNQCSLYELTEDKAIILTPDIICKHIIQSQLDIITASLIDVLDLESPLLVEVYQQSELPSYSEIVSPVPEYDEDDFQGMTIQPERTFENFVVGDCNRESQAAALACAIDPGKFFNPLFIYGNSGLGKTHLLMAIGNHVLQVDPTKKVYYTEALKFVETVVNAIQEGKIEAFKHYMYNLDLLLVDDIQFLAGKEKSHEIFFTIYNELVNNHKQICLASDRLPTEIKGLESRLITRFSSGLSVGIDSPEFETSLAILKNKIKQNGYGYDVDIEDEGLAYIASNFSGNVRALEGALNQVLFNAIIYQPEGDIIKFQTVMDALKN